ncbi:hypothetical protein [Sphingomonas sp.]|uniref:DUF7673 family protein n=1 Tax=Sphingomonas sp. TaxID=28214 RepID=UPI00307DE28D
MDILPIDRASTESAIERLIDLARSDTGQARRVARFLMAWWNGPDLGHFEIADLFGLDLSVAADIATVIGFLGQHSGAIYIDALGYEADMQDIIARWRSPADTEAATSPND